MLDTLQCNLVHVINDVFERIIYDVALSLGREEFKSIVKNIAIFSYSLNLPQVVFQLTNKLKNNYNNPTVTYQLGKTIRSKILNYKEAVNSICVDEDVSFCFNIDQCDCADLPSAILITRT